LRQAWPKWPDRPARRSAPLIDYSSTTYVAEHTPKSGTLGAIFALITASTYREAIMDEHDKKEKPTSDEKQYQAPQHLTKEDYEDMIRRSRELIKRVDSYLSRDTDPEQ
jgi:hypothetical protein